MLGAACSGTDDERGEARPTVTTAVDRGAWSEQLDDRCATLNEEFDQLDETVPTDRDDAVAYARSIESFAGELVDVLEDAGVPDADRDDADELIDLVDQLDAAASQLAAAAEDGDPDAATAATQRLAAVGADINAVAIALDAPACGGF